MILLYATVPHSWHFLGMFLVVVEEEILINNSATTVRPYICIDQKLQGIYMESC